ncbi:glycosyltransferase family 1 protein, partial [Streptomyces sp. NPDC005534]
TSLHHPEGERRQAARARAECFGWDAAVAGFLAAHDVPVQTPPRPQELRELQEGVA